MTTDLESSQDAYIKELEKQFADIQITNLEIMKVLSELMPRLIMLEQKVKELCQS